MTILGSISHIFSSRDIAAFRSSALCLFQDYYEIRVTRSLVSICHVEIVVRCDQIVAAETIAIECREERIVVTLWVSTLIQAIQHRKIVRIVSITEDLKQSTQPSSSHTHTIRQAQHRAAGDRSGRKYSEKYVFMSKNMTFGSLWPLLPFSRSPPKLIKKQKFSKMIFFAVFLCHIEPTCQKLCFYIKNCEFWPLGPLLPF